MKRKNPKAPASQSQSERVAVQAPRGVAKGQRPWVSVSMVVLDRPEPIPRALKKKR